jgi:NitT/TauT family transport system substrate-binding protein
MSVRGIVKSVGFVALAAFGALSLLPAAAQAQPTKVKFGYSASAGFMSSYIAKDQGLFEKHGLDVEMVYMTKGSIIPASLVGGSLDVGIVTAPSMIRTAEGGMDLVALAATNVNSPSKRVIALMVRNDLKIEKAQDFEGKRIGIAGRYGILDTLFQKWVADRGGDLKKITFLEVGFAQMGDMLKSGQIDGATVVEPFLGRMEKAGSAKVGVEYMKDLPDGMVQGAFMATRKWAEANRAAALGFGKAIHEAVKMYEANPEIANPSLAKHLRLKIDIVKNLPKPVIKAGITPEQLEFWNDVAMTYGITRAKVDVSKLIFK